MHRSCVKLHSTSSGRKYIMIRIGTLTPLFFNTFNDKFAIKSGYVQRFYKDDKITFQVFSDIEEVVKATLNTRNTSQSVSLKTLQVNSTTKMSYRTLSGLDDDYYSITISSPDAEITSEIFQVSSCDFILEDTSLIQYSDSTDRGRTDNIFFPYSLRHWFDFRTECGFKADGFTFHMTGDNLRSQTNEIFNIGSMSYNKQIFTIGSNTMGVPNHIARLINDLFCVSHVYVDGVRFKRSDNSVPEKKEEGSPNRQTFIFSMQLEEAYTDRTVKISDPLILRRTTNKYLSWNNIPRKIIY